MKRCWPLLSLLMIAVCGSASAKLADPGDLNYDGRLTIADVQLALRSALGLRPYEGYELEILDLVPSPGIGSRAGWRYGDGIVNLQDVTRILRGVVGLETLGDNWPPPQISWNGAYLVMDSGDALPPGGSVAMDFRWEGTGPVNWRVEPPEAATLRLMPDERSALLTANADANGMNFTVLGGEAPYEATRLGAVRDAAEVSPLDLRLTTDRTEYPPLDPVQITVTATNARNGPYTTGAGVRLLAFDNETRRLAWEARDPQWEQKVEFAPGETRTWAFEWNWKGLDGYGVQPRTYSLFAMLDLSPAVISLPEEVTRIAVY